MYPTKSYFYLLLHHGKDDLIGKHYVKTKKPLEDQMFCKLPEDEVYIRLVSKLGIDFDYDWDRLSVIGIDVMGWTTPTRI